jgi:hypothetical protein
VNCLLVYILLRKCDFKNTEIRLIFLFAVIELIVGGQLMAMAIFKLIYGYQWFDANTIQCQVFSFLQQWINRVEIATVAILAILRYLIVCHKKELSFVYWLLILLISIIPCTFVYGYGAALKDPSPSISYLQCMPFKSPGKISYVMTIFIPFLYLIPCWIVTVCYFLIGRTANGHLNIVKAGAIMNGDEHLLKSIMNQRIKLCIQLLVVFIIYNANFMLSYITFILKFAIGYKRTPIVDSLVLIFIYFTIAINSIITITFQPEVNNEFLFLIVLYTTKFKSLIRNIYTR